MSVFPGGATEKKTLVEMETDLSTIEKIVQTTSTGADTTAALSPSFVAMAESSVIVCCHIPSFVLDNQFGCMLLIY